MAPRAAATRAPWTRSRRRGFGGSGGPLSRHAHGARRSPPAGSVGYWPRGLAFRMDISVSWPLSGQHRGSARGSASRQSDTPDGFHRSKVGPRPATKGLATRRPPSLTSGRYFEAELERPVCRQVVAGPCNQPTPTRAASRCRDVCVGGHVRLPLSGVTRRLSQPRDSKKEIDSRTAS